MGNYHNTAVVLKTKEDFDIAWQIVDDSDRTDGGVFAQITSNFIVNFDIKYDMDWAFVRKISKAVKNPIKVYTYYDGNGGTMVTVYDNGRRVSQTVLNEYDVEYWQALIYVFGNIDYTCPFGDNDEFFVKGGYKYSFLPKAGIRNWRNGTTVMESHLYDIDKLPSLFKSVEEKYAEVTAK